MDKLPCSIESEIEQFANGTPLLVNSKMVRSFFFKLLLLNILVVDRLINAGEETLMFKLSQIIYDFSCGIHLKKK